MYVVLHMYQLDQVCCVIQIFYILPDLFYFVLSITEKCLLKSPTILVDLSTSLFILPVFTYHILMFCYQCLHVKNSYIFWEGWYFHHKMSLYHLSLTAFFLRMCDFNIAMLEFLIWWEGHYLWFFYFHHFIFNLSPYIKCVISRQHVVFYICSYSVFLFVRIFGLFTSNVFIDIFEFSHCST